ncbi:MAG: NDP-sugar synthase [Promethearchaeota archaeon]|nr:MAG: NDP-sugar synthase [Candidatus Lokiarchaeota archaeon]
MTKGIILSGGWGTRLRPLTCTIPKTLMPVVNKPVIERQMQHLKKAGVKEIVLAVSVMANDLKNYFQDGERLGIKIHYTNEKDPMGTAGAIKLAESFLKDENFFMLNGDVILNFDFKEMLKKHENYGGIGTIASKVVNDPSRYGVLIDDKNSNQILKFLEKSEYQPPEGKQVPMPINAGIYILEPSIFSYIEPNKKISIERDIFPNFAKERKLYHYPIEGVWKDIGKPEELLEGNILLMNDILKNLKEKRENLIDNNVKLDKSVLIYPPVSIGENVVIEKNCIIGPNVIIGNNVKIDENTEIKESLIYSDNYISKNVKIERSIVSDNCNIDNGAVLEGNENGLVILASFVQVLENVRIISNTNNSISVCHHEVIKENRISSDYFTSESVGD